MKIRVMGIGDYGQVYALWKNTPNMGLNNIDDSKDGIHKYLLRNPNTCFVAEQGGKIVGVILSGHDGRRGYMHHAAVAQDFQRQGIGAKLVNAAMAALENEGVTKVALVVYEKNESGNKFWESLGFTMRTDLVCRNKEISKSIRYEG
ncbi:MAG: GNAT family N-acetyltransferase [Oscillospiraceae bacterium]|nr:GNAT family N-acetyltransferase [Oscillospiraceae bacterium]